MLTLENTKNTIALLDSIEPDDEYAYERAVLAYLKIGGLPVFIYELPVKDVPFFHARTHKDEDFFNKVSDISIPPNQYVSNFGRCNRPFQSVFYTSENRPTSYMELVEYWAEEKAIGETLKVTLGEWVFKKSINVIIITSPDPQKRISLFDKEHGEALDKVLSQYDGEELESQILFYNFIFDKFRKPAKKDLKTYIITSAYCNVVLMHANNEAEAIYYPSVPFNGNGVNLALSRDFFKPENLEINSAIRNEFEIIENSSKKKSFTEKSKIDAIEIDVQKDSIKWQV